MSTLLCIVSPAKASPPSGIALSRDSTTAWGQRIERRWWYLVRGPSWDDARRKLAQGSTVELRVEMTTGFPHDDHCLPPTPVEVVADFLLDGSGKVSRIG
ncbi:hypothetical protein AAHA92_23690 [Salvia divinorum]|uniref:Uncharacterized protein n=1 Tax=Salvia divinorum TaxID=28513 RepID=A0ABD1GT87_SALDI